MHGENETVASLIQPNTGNWDIERVQHILPVRVAIEVLKLLLPLELGDDKLSRENERNGEYSARSSYRLYKRLKKLTIDREISNVGG